MSLAAKCPFDVPSLIVDDEAVDSIRPCELVALSYNVRQHRWQARAPSSPPLPFSHFPIFEQCMESDGMILSGPAFASDIPMASSWSYSGRNTIIPGCPADLRPAFLRLRDMARPHAQDAATSPLFTMSDASLWGCTCTVRLGRTFAAYKRAQMVPV